MAFVVLMGILTFLVLVAIAWMNYDDRRSKSIESE